MAFSTAILVSALMALGVGVVHAASGGVSEHGQLAVKDGQLVDASGGKVQLKGMSLYWSVWMPQYYNEGAVEGVKNSCYSNVIRAAMAVENGGYLSDPSGSQALVETVIEAAIKNDIYVIVDWHDSDAQDHVDQAIAFFSNISAKYAGMPNVIYEAYNEPEQVSWSDVVKPYHEKVVAAIRANDANAVIVLGTPQWSQLVNEAAADPVSGTNLMYTLHFYAATHKQDLRDIAQEALDKGAALFVTEYGTVSADGSGSPDATSTQEWYDFLDKNSISYANWAISDKDEGASALVSGTTAQETCQAAYLTASGKIVVAQNQK